MSSRGLWSFPTDHTVDCFTALKVCEKSLPLSISITFFLLHKIFPADLKQHLGSSDENCWFTQLCIGYSRQCHSRSITIIHRETLNRTLNSNVVLGCKLSFTSNHVTYIIVHCAGNSADKDLKYASSGPIFQIADEHLSLKLPGDIHVSSQALKHNANAIQCCQKLFCGCGAFFFFPKCCDSGGQSFVGRHPASTYNTLCNLFCYSCYWKAWHNTLTVLSSSECLTTLSCSCWTWICWKAVAGGWAQVIDVFLGVKIWTAWFILIPVLVWKFIYLCSANREI